MISANDFNNLTYDEKIRYMIGELTYSLNEDISCISLMYDDEIYHKKMRYFNLGDFETLEEFKEYAYDNFTELVYNDELIRCSIEDYFVQIGIN